MRAHAGSATSAGVGTRVRTSPRVGTGMGGALALTLRCLGTSSSAACMAVAGREHGRVVFLVPFVLLEGGREGGCMQVRQVYAPGPWAGLR